MLSLFNGIEDIDEGTKLKMLIEWLSKYLNQQEIVSIIDEQLKLLENEEQEQQELENTDDAEYQMSAGGPPPSHDFTKGFDAEEPVEEPSVDVAPPELEVADQEDLANIEGEDLL